MEEWIIRIALFYYDKFAEFEIFLIVLIFHHKHEIISVAVENKE